MMDLDEIEKKIRQILKKNLIMLGLDGVSVDEIKPSDNFMDDLGIDSVGIMGFISDIERNFNFKIEEGELTFDNLGTIELTAKYVRKKI